MNGSHIFLGSAVLFICGWSAVALLYFFAVIPELKKTHGRKVCLEAGFQLNFSRHIREYGALAKQEKDGRKLKIFYLINILICASIIAFLTGILSAIF